MDRNRAERRATAADHYEVALKANAPDTVVRIAEPYRKVFTQDDLIGIDGVVFTGSGVSWSTNAPEAAALRAAGELVFNAGLPTIGSCNGLQLAATLLGGDIGPSPKGMEIGLAQNIKLTAEGRTHAMMAGRRDGYCVPCVHRDEVQRLPDGATLIAGNDHSPVQAMVYNTNGVNFWGMQYHPELSAPAIADYVKDGRGIFSQAQNLIEDLMVAETDASAAARLGSRPEDLLEKNRTTELANWLSLV
ncbi:type 1 glutamine amidotransferase [Kiloniella sp.]|uniref:type 1 glutamine amidotransferase n=1 Tax=Kiloniella sp. TaxID=1938587 RepID=UPI003B024A2B